MPSLFTKENKRRFFQKANLFQVAWPISSFPLWMCCLGLINVLERAVVGQIFKTDLYKPLVVMKSLREFTRDVFLQEHIADRSIQEGVTQDRTCEGSTIYKHLKYFEKFGWAIACVIVCTGSTYAGQLFVFVQTRHSEVAQETTNPIGRPGPPIDASSWRLLVRASHKSCYRQQE